MEPITNKNQGSDRAAYHARRISEKLSKSGIDTTTLTRGAFKGLIGAGGALIRYALNEEETSTAPDTMRIATDGGSEVFANLMHRLFGDALRQTTSWSEMIDSALVGKDRTLEDAMEEKYSLETPDKVTFKWLQEHPSVLVDATCAQSVQRRASASGSSPFVHPYLTEFHNQVQNLRKEVFLKSKLFKD